MSALVNPTQLDTTAKAQLAKDGFLKLGALFTPAAVEGFRTLLGTELRDERADRSEQELVRLGGGGQFARYSNNVNLRGSLLESLRSSTEFRALCADIDEGRWLLTQGLGFEIKPGQRGLVWHWGFRSFCFTRAEDQGYTLWIPLDDVDVQKQNGGLPVVSESVYSGREETRLLSAYCRGHEDPELLGVAGGNIAGFSALRNAVLDRNKVEYSFVPGDALLFSRYVFHRSAPFLEGPQQRRRAFVLRLIPASARYCPSLFRDATALFTKFGMHTHEDPVGLRLTDISEGDELSNSKLLARLY